MDAMGKLRDALAAMLQSTEPDVVAQSPPAAP
jgi:hypothetical protein